MLSHVEKSLRPGRLRNERPGMVTLSAIGVPGLVPRAGVDACNPALGAAGAVGLPVDEANRAPRAARGAAVVHAT
jgi:hypothetical protein